MDRGKTSAGTVTRRARLEQHLVRIHRRFAEITHTVVPAPKAGSRRQAKIAGDFFDETADPLHQAFRTLPIGRGREDRDVMSADTADHVGYSPARRTGPVYLFTQLTHQPLGID